MARSRLSRTIPTRIEGENRQSRAESPASPGGSRPGAGGGTTGRVRPSDARTCRIHASAPVRDRAAWSRPSQSTPSSYASMTGKTSKSDGSGRLWRPSTTSEEAQGGLGCSTRGARFRRARLDGDAGDTNSEYMDSEGSAEREPAVVDPAGGLVGDPSGHGRFAAAAAGRVG